MVQMHIIILEASIKEKLEINKELYISNFIQYVHNKNHYDKKIKFSTNSKHCFEIFQVRRN